MSSIQITKAELQQGIRRYTRILEADSSLYNAINKTIRENSPIGLDTQLYLYAFVPAIIAFSTWVLDEAIKRGKNRLYYLSRDGYQMYIASQKIAASRGVDIECRYLHVSRYSMRIPSYHMDVIKSIDSICTGGIDVTIDKILRRASLTDEECQKVIEELSLDDIKNEIFNYQQIIQLREKLKQSNLLHKYITAHSLEAYRPAIGYLKQEGLCDDDKYMLVDSGWIGTLQQSIETMIHTVNPDIKVEGCYFGMYEMPLNELPDKYHCFYFGSKWGLWQKVHFSNSLFETVISSAEGMTTGYRDNGGKLECIQGLPNANRDMHIRNAAALTEMLDIYMNYVDKPQISFGLIEQLLSTLMALPTKLELAAYGDKLFSDDVTDNDNVYVARNLSEKDIHNQRIINKICIIKGLMKGKLHESAWLEGSTARLYADTPHKAVKEYRHIRMYKYIIYIRKQITGD